MRQSVRCMAHFSGRQPLSSSSTLQVNVSGRKAAKKEKEKVWSAEQMGTVREMTEIAAGNNSILFFTPPWRHHRHIRCLFPDGNI